MLQILAFNNKVSAMLYMAAFISNSMKHYLTTISVGLKLAENLFACCRTPSLGPNSRFKTGYWLSDNNVCLVKLLLYSLSKLIYIALYKLFITNLVMHYSWEQNAAFNHKFN